MQKNLHSGKLQTKNKEKKMQGERVSWASLPLEYIGHLLDNLYKHVKKHGNGNGEKYAVEQWILLEGEERNAS